MKLFHMKKNPYFLLRFKNTVRRFFLGTCEYHFLFILSPPYCGSTMLNELISTSDSVSNINPFGNREGKTLPRVKKIMKKSTRWNVKTELPWAYIKQEWLKYWDITKPLLLEKSPMNIQYAKEISSTFNPAYFIIFYRNPYAHCEGLLRRQNLSPKEAASFAIDCLKHQKWNIENLTTSTHLSYESLTNNLTQEVDKLIKFIPKLGKINTDIKVKAHNLFNQVMKIKNMNEDKISKLSHSDITAINDVFNENKDLLQYFGYSLINQQ